MFMGLSILVALKIKTFARVLHAHKHEFSNNFSTSVAKYSSTTAKCIGAQHQAQIGENEEHPM